jgi:hypothetical protein
MAEQCFVKAQHLTSIMTTWIPEEDLHSHHLLQTEHDVYKKSHHSASAPLHDLSAQDTAKKVCKTNSELYIQDEEVIRNDQPADDSPWDLPSAPSSTSPTPPSPEDLISSYDDFGRVILEMTPPTDHRDKRQVLKGGLLGALGAAGTFVAGAFSNLFHSGASTAAVKHIALDTKAIFSIEEHRLDQVNSSLFRAVGLMRETESEIEYVYAKHKWNSQL